ncbi:MAG: hypothetical protein K2I17_00775 [Clostridia bacterium]|nr:hypothetical protein [Clostridia bacterium]
MLYILTPIFCVASLCGTVFSFSKTDNKVYAATTPKTNAAYLDLNGSGNILNGFEGKQKEKVYFGTNIDSSLDYGNDGANAHTGAIKWSVLAKNDGKYGNGTGSNNLLLFADYQIGREYYNMYYRNPEYAFWGTSYIHAIMNGGASLSSVGTSSTAIPDLDRTFSESESYYGHIFSLGEKAAVNAAREYTTDLYGMYNYRTVGGANGTKLYQYSVTSIIAEGSDENGKYNTGRFNNPSATYARVTSDGGVQETTSGDKLFLLDYYDVNNLDYGFGDDTDNDGVVDQTYASKIDPDWKTSNAFPNPYNDDSATVSYLSYSDDLADFYWLRNSGRYSTTNSDAMVIDSSGFVSDHYVDWYWTSSKPRKPAGVRPAFVLDTTKIAYATAEIPGTGWANMTNVPTTPEYKLYLKDGSYAANTANAKALIGANGSTLHIKYNNPTNVRDGKLIVLLTPSSSTGGEVDYQQAITMDSSATAAKMAYTTLTLPANVSLATHDVTLLYTTANSGHSTDSIYCSYGMNAIDAPLDIEVTYDGNSKWLTALSGNDKPDWLDTDVYCNEAYMSVDTIKYTDNLGNPESVIYNSATSSALPDIKAAGTYVVAMKIEAHLRWAGEAADGGTKNFTIKIKQKPSTPKPKVDPPQTTTPYESAGLPNLIADTDSTPGTFTWGTNEVATAGTKEYNWNFTPTDANNFTTATGKMELEFLARELSSIAVTAYNPGTNTVYTDTSLATIKSYLTVQATYTDGSSETLTSYKLEVDSSDGKLVAGNNTLVISSNDDSQTITYPITGVVAKAVSAINVVQLSNSTFKFPVTTEEIKAAISRVNVQWNTGASGNLESFDDVTVSGTLNAGNSVTVTVGIDGTTATKNITVRIDKGDFDVSGITFTGDTLTYDGNSHKLEIAGTLPDGVSVNYAVAGQTATAFTNAGTYNYTASFTHGNANYNTISTTLTATLQIDKASYEKPTGYDETKQVTYTGSAISLPANWITGLDPDVTVTYCEADGTTPFAAKTAVGKYTVKAVFSVADPANYEVPETVTLTFEITDKKIYTPSVTFEDVTVTYDGQPHTIAIDGVVPGWITVTYYKEDGTTVFTDATDVADSGKVIARFTHSDPEYADIPDMTATLTINPADYDMSGITFEDKTEIFNGTAYTLVISGDLPAWITPSYSVDGQTGTSFSAAGTYEFTVSFTHTDGNYNPIADKTATLTISDAVVVAVSAKVEDGADFNANDTLDDLKAKLTAEIEYNNGNKESVAVEDLEVTCNDLRDGNKFKAGLQSITVKYTDENGKEVSTAVNITVQKVKVALPVYSGGLKYTGVAIKPTVDNFNGFDGELMTFVTDKLQSGLAVGLYKAVFALNDNENYEWATVTTLKKTVFAAAIYDGEVTLLANEAAVDWSIAKAVITATKKDNALPVFASESYMGAFSDVVGLKYYTDEACTEEVAAEDLKYETQYFVKAELIDTDNFELDASAAQYAVKSFSYTTPAKQLTGFEKVLAVIKANWLWIVIAAVALILLILIIALAVRSSKKKREREERRLAEEKAERERKEEERERREEERRQREEERRREEREERMAARMAMPQMMPQMPQQMPQAQGVPQAQTMAAGGGSAISEAQFVHLQMQAELAALKAEQTAKELAELKAKQATEQQLAQTKLEMQFANMAARSGGEQVVQGGISLDKLTELIRTEVNAALNGREKAALPATAAPEGAATATTQVPPDAVMTTVTTTKIDTTKKPVQSAQAQAPAPAVRTVVRNVVAPMPVDDGRVFDVGGFYTPVDPLTDLNLDDVEKKD